MGFVDDVIMTKPESSKIDVSSFIIDLAEQVPDPQPIVRIWGNLIASRGNISTVVGLAKSRKTFLTAAIASGYLSESEFIGFDTPATGKIVYIDTEQAKAHVHKVARRILRSIGLPTNRNHDQLVVAALRELTPDQRKDATGEILRRYKPDLLILDGVADLCNDPFTEFAFQINASGLPELCSIPAPHPKEDVFAEIMVAGRVYTHSELVGLLVEHADIKEGNAKMKISRAAKAGGIVKTQAGGYYLPGSKAEVMQPELSNEPF